MSQSGYHWFFGKSELKYKGRSVYVHVYDAAKPDFSANRAKYGAKDYIPHEHEAQTGLLRVTNYGIQKMFLALFVADSGNRKRWKRLNLIEFSYVRAVYNPFQTGPLDSKDMIGVDTLWLDPQHKTIPMLKIGLYYPRAPVLTGTEMLIPFPNGLTGNAVATGFSLIAGGNSSDGSAWMSTFKTVDEKGFLTINSRYWNTTYHIDTLLKWNGTSFIAVKQEKKDTII